MEIASFLNKSPPGFCLAWQNRGDENEGETAVFNYVIILVHHFRCIISLSKIRTSYRKGVSKLLKECGGSGPIG
jgi:hypothetical protein